ncbi:kynureninase [Aliiroseovarius sp.]|uniref:kynureninase n=1 Tax=Aliiroseovarius sp. TaxID=1872442 RepID=UPI00261E7C1C|nr:kynureninase [Aliiroseovarius sp.]
MDFTATKALFDLPPGMVYLDGNSLGPLPRSAAARVAKTMTEEWGQMLITAWNRAGWMAQPTALGDRIGRLIGAGPGSVTTGDTLSVKVYQALAAALSLRPDRRVILSDTGNFPSDLYMAQGLSRALGHGHKLVTVAPEEVAARIGPDVAVLMLTEVDYRTGRRHDMPALIRAAHAAGALVIWDLAHSAGALPVDLSGSGVDFACGCTYKFLNAGPGAPAFIYVAPRHQGAVAPALSGWLGHEAPFAFDPDYRPGMGIERMRVGTPPVLQMAALDAALEIWDRVDMQVLRARSIELSERFIAGVEAICPELRLASPRDPEKRGSQVSFHFHEGYAAMQALIARGVVGDFRAPDIMRFGITPLYIDEGDIDRAVAVMGEVMGGRLWDREEYRTRSAVT